MPAAIFSTILFIAATVLYIFLVLKPNQDAKNKLKQKAKKDTEAKRKADAVFNEYPTICRNNADESFRDTELGY